MVLAAMNRSIDSSVTHTARPTFTKSRFFRLRNQSRSVAGFTPSRTTDGHTIVEFTELEWPRYRAVVTDWLNAAKGTESYVRVEKLIDEIRHVERGLDKALREGWYRSSAGHPQPTAVTEFLRELDRRHDGINELLARYSFSPVIRRALIARRWSLWMFSTLAPDEYAYERVVHEEKPRRLSGGGLQVLAHHEHTVGEADVVLRILNLAAASELERIKQCESCWKWFYAERSHQKFCPGGQCRLTKYSQSPKYKNYRKLYMRQHRAQQAEQSVKHSPGKGK